MQNKNDNSNIQKLASCLLCKGPLLHALHMQTHLTLRNFFTQGTYCSWEKWVLDKLSNLPTYTPNYLAHTIWALSYLSCLVPLLIFCHLTPFITESSSISSIYKFISQSISYKAWPLLLFQKTEFLLLQKAMDSSLRQVEWPTFRTKVTDLLFRVSQIQKNSTQSMHGIRQHVLFPKYLFEGSQTE